MCIQIRQVMGPRCLVESLGEMEQPFTPMLSQHVSLSVQKWITTSLIRYLRVFAGAIGCQDVGKLEVNREGP